MNLLGKIHRGKQPAPRRVLLYGTHGIGKSTFGAMAPSPVFIQTEDGLGGIDCDKFPLAKQYGDVLGAMADLYSEPHEYRTVVLDSLDWLEQLIWANVCQQRGVASIEDIGYAKGYTYALNQWRQILEGLEALRNSRGMMIVLLAHAKIETFQSPDTESYDRYSPRLHKLASALVQEWCDEVLFATYKVYTKQLDEGFNQKRAQGIGDGERILRSTERPAHMAKNRLCLPDELPLDFNAYARFFSNDNTTSPSNQPSTQGKANHGNA